MLVSMLIYCALGSVAGILAGLLGVGGGIVIVPMLVFAFNWQGDRKSTRLNSSH